MWLKQRSFDFSQFMNASVLKLLISSCSVVRFDELIMPVTDKYEQSIVRIKWLLTDKKPCENKCIQPFDQRV